MNRRNFVNTTTIGAGGVLITGLSSCANGREKNDQKMKEEKVASMVKGIAHIGLDEIQSRIANAQRLMREYEIGALLLDAGTSLRYFTGLAWWPSQRPMVTVIPATGEISCICPAFEEARLQEIIKVGSKIYTWEEDENPYAQVAVALKEAGVSKGKLGVEERMRFFIFNGIKKLRPVWKWLAETHYDTL